MFAFNYMLEGTFVAETALWVKTCMDSGEG